MLTKLGAILGLLLLVIGTGIPNRGTLLAGDFIFAVALIWGGLDSSEENIPLRITMLAVGGLFTIAAFASSLGLTSLFTGR
jgi:hypothetical protein